MSVSPKLVALLGVITLAAVAWFTLSGGSSSEPAGDVASVHSRYEKAAATIIAKGSSVHASPDLNAFNATCTASLSTMAKEVQAFSGLAKDESGQTATIATQTRDAAQRGLDAATAYCSALGRSRLADAKRAQEQLDTATQDLNSQIKAWEQS